MRILVTGSEGYVGTRLVPLLQARGHDVSGVDSHLFEDCTFGTYEPQVRAARRDIRELGGPDLAAYDAIIHLAGLSNDPLSDLDPERTREINHHASVRLAALARAAGVSRFVFASSCSVYGNAVETCIDEERAPAPLTPYAQSKAAAERDIMQMAGGGFCPVFLRHGTAYGASPRVRFDLVLNNLVAHAVTSGRILLKSDGAAWRPLVHVEDIGIAFVAAVEAPDAVVNGEIFNIGRNDDNIRVRDLAQAVADAVPGSRLAFAAGAGADRRSYRVDFGKAEKSLPGFRPRWNIARGIAEMVTACRANRLHAGEFEGARFDRIAHLKRQIALGRIDRTLRRTSPAAMAGL